MTKKVTPIDKIDLIIELFNDGNLNQALKNVENSIINYPNDPILLNIAGACYAGTGKLNKAAKSYKKAILIKPDFADFHYNLGNVLNDLGDHQKAIESFKNTLKILPNNSAASFNLGVTLQKLGQIDEAIDFYEKASLSDPENINAKVNLGLAYQEIGSFDQAINQYNQVLKISPNTIEVLNNLGVIYREIDQANESISFYKEALAIDPNHTSSHYNLGFTYQDLGQIDKAIHHYQKALDISDNSWSFHNLSYLKKFKPNDPQISKMESLLSDEKLSQLDQIHICLGLARVYDSFDEKNKFFYFLNKGNSLRKKVIDYSFEETKLMHSTIKNIFKKKSTLIYSPKKNQSFNKRPIFILGMPRSGTSLVEQIISSHKLVYGAGELEKMTRLIKPIVKNFINGDINNISEQTLNFITNDYQDTLMSFDSDASIITDKLPLNFQYIGFILEALPNAKIIHLKRDARATCWSNFKHFFSSKDNGYSHDLIDLANFYKSYRNLMDFWHEIYPDRIYDLGYESLTLDQESEIRKLLEYCDLDWDQNCLKFYENTRAVRTPSSPQVRKKMYQGSSVAWKKYSSHIQPLISALEKY
jgi:tetratricopeptide (TPR) repeat protein